MRAEDEGGPEGPKFALKIGKRGYVRGRSKRILVKLTEDEHSSIEAAGQLVQLSPTGFTAEAALAAAQAKLDAFDVFEKTGVWPAERSSGVLDQGQLRDAALRLMEATAEVNKVGSNLNQAVRKFNATGVAPGWLKEIAEQVRSKVDVLDEEAYQLAQIVGRRRDR